MHKEVISNIEGVSLFPVIAIVLFLIIFSGILIYVWRMKPEKTHLIANIPLQDHSLSTTEKLPLR